MRTRVFPDGTAVSAIGAGDVSLATAALRNVHAGDVARALETALDLGITFFDVAAEPDAERLVGQLVRARRLRDQVVVATRVPMVRDHFGVVIREVLDERLPPAHVQATVEASLRATALDVLPLVQLALRPSWLRAAAWPELAETCERLVREGKVVRWGAYEIEDVDQRPLEPDEPPPPSALDAPWLVTRLMPLSMCERSALGGPRSAPEGERGSIERKATTEKLLLAQRPLAGGALAGALGPGAKLAIKDDRLDVDAAMMIRYAVMAARLAPFVKQVPASARSCVEARGYLEQGVRPERVECQTLAELALRWVIDRGALALPRLHRAEHVLEAVGAGMAPTLAYDPVS